MHAEKCKIMFSIIATNSLFQNLLRSWCVGPFLSCYCLFVCLFFGHWIFFWFFVCLFASLVKLNFSTELCNNTVILLFNLCMSRILNFISFRCGCMQPCIIIICTIYVNVYFNEKFHEPSIKWHAPKCDWKCAAHYLYTFTRLTNKCPNYSNRIFPCTHIYGSIIIVNWSIRAMIIINWAACLKCPK